MTFDWARADAWTECPHEKESGVVRFAERDEDVRWCEAQGYPVNRLPDGQAGYVRLCYDCAWSMPSAKRLDEQKQAAQERAAARDADRRRQKVEEASRREAAGESMQVCQECGEVFSDGEAATVVVCDEHDGDRVDREERRNCTECGRFMRLETALGCPTCLGNSSPYIALEVEAAG